MHHSLVGVDEALANIPETLPDYLQDDASPENVEPEIIEKQKF